MFVAERYLSGLVKVHGKYPVSADGGTWYPMACRFLKLKHHIHSPYEKSIIKRTMQYVKDRTECFDDYFPCRKKNCKLKHVRNWLNLYEGYHNSELNMVKCAEPLNQTIDRVIHFLYLIVLTSHNYNNNNSLDIYSPNFFISSA